MNTFKFENGLLCKLHKHGASCAIDTMLELYYYGVFRWNFCTPIKGNGELVNLLNSACRARASEEKTPDCSLREPLWNWLIKHHPGAFAPKGRGDAEFIIALQELTENCGDFHSTFSCQSICQSCNISTHGTSKIGILSITSKCNMLGNGLLEQVIEQQYNHYCRSRLPLCCKQKKKPVNGNLSLPKYLAIELGVKDSHNVFEPPLRINEYITVWNMVYSLVSAVIVEPQHFLNVSRVGSHFVVLDGLKQNPIHFPNFSSAVRQVDVSESHYTTSHHERGIHILLFENCEEELISVPVSCINFARQEYPQDIAENEEVIKLDGDESHLPSKSNSDLPSSGCVDVGFIKESHDKYEQNITPKSRLSVKLENRYNKSANKVRDKPCFPPRTKEKLLTKPKQPKLNKTNGIKAGSKLGEKAKLSESEFAFAGHSIPYVVKDNFIFFSCPVFIHVLGIKKHISKEGYKFTDKKLSDKGLCSENSFIRLGNVRKYIRYDAALILAAEQNKLTLVLELLSWINHVACGSNRGKMCPVKQNDFYPTVNDQNTNARNLACENGSRDRDSKLSISQPPQNKTFQEQNISRNIKSEIDTMPRYYLKNAMSEPGRTKENVTKQTVHIDETFPTVGEHNCPPLLSQQLASQQMWAYKKNEKKKISIREVILDLYNEKYDRSKVRLIKGLASLIKPSRINAYSKFDGKFSKDDILLLLKLAKSSDESKHSNFLEEISGTSLSTDDVINLQENFSGVRLVHELRRKLPGMVPSSQLEQRRKKEYNDEFEVILNPNRTATGWKISPERLSEVLSFQYFWISGSKYWRVYGDGREIGGRQSCFISLSLVNNELALRDCSYQSPQSIYPVGLFYEGDSRNNLEENLGFPNSWLNKFIANENLNGDQFFLCGDEMFLEAILDGKNELRPTSNNGWNIYTKCTKDQKNLTDAVTKKRTDLHPNIDREYPTSILRSIPLENTVFCLLHGLARCVEKLLTLVVQYILLYSNIVNEQGLDGTSYRKEKLHTLETNINKRGVRQGKFIIPFDAGGKLQQIKLNKDHAWVIISPAPAGKENEYPHVLTDVFPDINHRITIPLNVCMELKIKDHYSESELVSAIWAHFYEMIVILKKDPSPKPKSQGHSTNPNDFSWGFTSEDVDSYKEHAERFYQLFSFRYTARELTPYMIKLIDYGPYFMKNLPVPLCRFQAEGGEHTNYEHSTFYYNHTTRHGGNFTLDPMLAIFRNMWRRICYKISTNTDTPEGRAASAAFEQYKLQHKAAAVIQRVFRKHHKQRIGKATCITTEPSKVFHGVVFVLSGSIPKIDGKSYSHADFKRLIENSGGRVTSCLPAKNKRSTKEYVILTKKTDGTMKMPPACILEALRENYKVLSFQYVLDSIKQGRQGNADNYVVSFRNIPFRTSRYRTLKAFTSVKESPC